LPVARHGTASAAFLGSGLELRLESRQFRKRRIGISLLLTLAVRREIATIAPALARARPVTTAAIAAAMLTLAVLALTIALAFRTVLRAMLARRAPLAALVAIAPEFTVAALTAMLAALFVGRNGIRRLGDGFAVPFGRSDPVGGCAGPFGLRLVRLMSALPMTRTPLLLAAPLVAAASGTPHLDHLGFRRNRRRLRSSRCDRC
jgi:hypothetical protein